MITTRDKMGVAVALGSSGDGGSNAGRARGCDFGGVGWRQRRPVAGKRLTSTGYKGHTFILYLPNGNEGMLSVQPGFVPRKPPRIRNWLPQRMALHKCTTRGVCHRGAPKSCSAGCRDLACNHKRGGHQSLLAH